ncbi:tape measure protein [Bifidobacterium cuniculi]|uniref:Phage tale measure protein n=1 Tax=Bifidobacterium cuniculi TaxID=1688 RepID=A0A087B412_9BIFI|nr:tape measure protein [Bifidobacterium cuniculi]KFI65762.1 phage tale measure protein [Bifidobacterium cuniculi]
MAQELGTGYIIIQPSTKGLGKAIEGSIDTATTTGSAKSSKTLLQRLGGTFGKIGKIGVAATSAIGGAVVGLAAKGGFDRALNIERAQTKLKALGHDTKSIDGIMSDALASVKGTAFGLGDAASVAAQLVASGVKQGKELENALTLVGDAAQVAGVEFTDMGTIFSKVAATGHLQGDEMNQLMEAGIPVLQDLAKHYGITADEAREMVSDGKVSFEDFSAAMQEHFGGAAQRAGESFDGAMANIKAALSRVGEGFGTPLIKGATKLANQLIPVVDQLAGAFKPLQKQFETVFGDVVDKAGIHIDEFSKKLESGEITIQDLGRQLGLLAGGFATLAAVGGNINPLLDAVNQFADGADSAVAKAGDAFKALPGKISEHLESGRGIITRFKGLFDKDIREMLLVDSDTFTSAAERIKNGLSGIGDHFKNGFDKLADTKLGSKVGKVFDAMKTGIGTGAAKVKGAITEKMAGLAFSFENNPVVTSVKDLGGKIAGSLGALGGKITSSMSSLGGKVKGALAPVGEIFGGIGDMVGPKLKGGLDKVGGMLTSFFSPGNFMKFVGIGAIAAALVAGIGMINEATGGKAAEMASNLVAKLTDAIGKAMEWITNSLPGLMQSGSDIILAILNGITAMLPSLATMAGQAINTLVTGLAAALPQLIPAAVNAITTLVTSLIDQLPLLIDAGMQLLQGLVEGLVNSIPVLVAALPEIIDSLVTAITTSLPDIIESGVDILNALVDGLIQAIPALVEALPEIIDALVGGITENLPAIIDAGVDLLLALIDGLVKALPEIAKALPKILEAIVEGIIDNLPMIIEAAVYLMIALAEGLIKAIPELLKAIPDIFNALCEGFAETDWGQLGHDLLDAVGEGLEAAKDALGEVWNNIWNGIKDKAGEIWENIKTTVSDKFNEVKDGIGSKFEEIKTGWSEGWENVKSKCSDTWDSIKSGVASKWEETKTNVSDGMSKLKSDWSSGWEDTKSKCGNAWNTIKTNCSNGINNAKTNISNGLGNIKSNWSSGWESMKTKMGNVWEGIKSGVSTGINNVMDSVRGIKDRITGFFSGAGQWLVDSGRSIINGLGEGISSAFNHVKGMLSDGLQSLRNLLPFSPAKEGPFSGHGWTLYSGRSIMQAMAQGIEDETDGAVKTMDRAMGRLYQSANSANTGKYGVGFDLQAQLDEAVANLRLSVPWDGISPVDAYPAGKTVNYTIEINGERLDADRRLATLLDELVAACGVSLKART